MLTNTAAQLVRTLPDGTTGLALDRFIARLHRASHTEICERAGLATGVSIVLFGERTVCILEPSKLPFRCMVMRPTTDSRVKPCRGCKDKKRAPKPCADCAKDKLLR